MTQPAPSAPIHTAALASSPTRDGSVLRVVVQGFSAMEQSLLDGMVRLSQRRTPRLELVSPEQHAQADVVMVDTRDPAAMAWAAGTEGLPHRAVIWVDGSAAAAGHTLARRPIQWSILPMLLARALELRTAAAPQASALVALPAPGAVEALSAAAAPAAAAVTPILVVDDSLAVRAHMRAVLEQRGYRVVEAAGGQAALQALAEQHCALVFMDVLMPEIDGYEACKRIKAQQRTLGVVRVVMLTSRNSPFDRIRGKMSGCDGYLTKPADTAALQGVLDRFAGKPAAPPVPATTQADQPAQPAPPARPGRLAPPAARGYLPTVPSALDTPAAPAQPPSIPVLFGGAPERR